MSTFTEYQTLTYSTLSCGVCGVRFALEKDRHEKMMESGDAFFCPNGHEISYSGNEVKRLQKQLAQAQYDMRQSKCETMAERNLREIAERRLKRVGRGVCPCCNRTFQNLARHMKTKHPETK